jgi:hypothetical protein
MMSGKNGSRQVIEAILACLARVSLPAPLAIVMAVADHCCTTAVKADNAVRPSELTNDVIALRFVEQVRQRDQVHHGFRSLPQRERPTDQRPNQNQHVELLPRTGSSIPCRGLFITPKPDKSLSPIRLPPVLCLAGHLSPAQPAAEPLVHPPKPCSSYRVDRKPHPPPQSSAEAGCLDSMPSGEQSGVCHLPILDPDFFSEALWFVPYRRTVAIQYQAVCGKL